MTKYIFISDHDKWVIERWERETGQSETYDDQIKREASLDEQVEWEEATRQLERELRHEPTNDEIQDRVQMNKETE